MEKMRELGQKLKYITLRYKRLSLWNKVAFWGAISSIIGVMYLIIQPFANNRLDQGVGDRNKIIFAAHIQTEIFSKYPGPLVYEYSLDSGKALAPIGIALVAEIINSSDKYTRLSSIGFDIKIDNKWERLNILPITDPTKVFWVRDNNRADCIRLDFSENLLDRKLFHTNLAPGKSEIGWIFLEWPKHLRVGKPKINGHKIILVSNQGVEQILPLDFQRTTEDNELILNGGFIKLFSPPEHCDLSKLRILPYVDFISEYKAINCIKTPIGLNHPPHHLRMVGFALRIL